jgi:hypothetical protein
MRDTTECNDWSGNHMATKIVEIAVRNRAMNLSMIVLVSSLALGVAGCTLSQRSDDFQKADQVGVARCQNWDAIAENAAHPDAATIARHDRLAEKAAELQAAAAVAQQLHGAALEAAIENIAQAQIEAKAVYDAPGKREIANRCWADLGLEREMQAGMIQKLATGAPQPPADGQPIYDPDMSIFTPPAAPPGSSPPPDLYAVQHGDIRLGSPDGPVIGQTTRIGSPAPSAVLVPVP